MDLTEASIRLRSMVASDEDPALDDEQLAQLLDMARRADIGGNAPTNLSSAPAWATATTYLAGDVITESGRWWRCEIAGASGTTEPTWPDLTGYKAGDVYVYDNDVTWVDNGAQWQPTWHLASAASEGWRWKAALAAGRFKFATDGQSFDRQQVAANCLTMAKAYSRLAPTSIRVLSAH